MRAGALRCSCSSARREQPACMPARLRCAALQQRMQQQDARLRLLSTHRLRAKTQASGRAFTCASAPSLATKLASILDSRPCAAFLAARSESGRLNAWQRAAAGRRQAEG